MGRASRSIRGHGSAVPGAGLLFAVVVGMGCGGAVARPAGRVTQGGMPAVGAQIVFTLEADDRTVRTGVSGSDGSYVLDHRGQRGMPPGRYTVVVTMITRRDGTPLPDGEAGVALRADATQTRELVRAFDRDVTVTGGRVDFEFDDGRAVEP